MRVGDILDNSIGNRKHSNSTDNIRLISIDALLWVPVALHLNIRSKANSSVKTFGFILLDFNVYYNYEQ